MIDRQALHRITTSCALVALVVAGPACQKKENAAGASSSAPAAAPSTRTFASWDAFTQSDARASARPRQTVFIGIDGATWEYLDGLLERGLLPNMARIRREGSYATLRSVQSYVSPPAWTSMLTGYLPTKSGIYTFGMFDKEIEAFASVRSTDVLVPFVWEAASRAGLKTAVVNVPMTYPVYPVNGIMASGLLTPIYVGLPATLRPSARTDLGGLFRDAELDAKSHLNDYSKPLASAAEDDLNLFIMLLHDTKNDSRQNYDTVSLTGYERAGDGTVGKRTGMWFFPIGEYSSWIDVRVIDEEQVRAGYGRMKLTIDKGEADIRFSETVFPIDATFTYPEALAGELEDHFGFYLPTKMVSKEIVPTLTKDMRTYVSYFYDYDDWDDFFFVFTQSDNIHHKDGFGELAESVYVEIDRCLGDMMARMPSDALLVVASDHGFKSYDYAIDLNRYLGELHLLKYDEGGHGGVDYNETLVLHNLWHLYFNRKKISREELAHRGIEAPPGADPVDFLMDYVTEKLRLIRTEDRAFPVEVERMPADAAGVAPDMRVTGSYGDYGVTYWNVMKPHGKVVWVPEGPDKFWHTRSGIVMLWGDGVKRGFDAGTVDIENIAPTISFALGLPIAPDMDGHVLSEMLEPQYVAGRPLFVNEGYRDAIRAEPETAEGREDLEKKLRSLGYIQ